jgi:hypothetical protein
MSENPYAQYPSRRDDFDMPYEGEQRLSIPAVLSLVASLICCIPGLGVLGMILGLVGVINISRSRGRLTGMPAAIVGIALGVIVTVAWVALGVGAGSAYNFWQVNITAPMSRLVESAYQGDVAAVRAEMTLGAQGQITDEEIHRFGQAMRAEFGEFRGMPTSLQETFKAIGEGFSRAQGKQVQSGGSSQSAVPMTLLTDNGGIVVFGVFDAQGQPSQVFRYQDLFVLLPNMEALLLRDDGPARLEALKLNFTPVTSAEYLERESGAPAPEAPGAPDASDTPAPDADAPDTE